MKSDGIRAEVGTQWVSERYFYRLPFVLKSVVGVEVVSIAHDVRCSSPALYQALVQGALDAGLSVSTLGLMPTPMVAKWVHDTSGVGLVVTASHNPVSDNGVKFLGLLLTDTEIKAVERQMSQVVHKEIASKPFDRSVEAKAHYLSQLAQATTQKKARCLLDTAQGAWHAHLDVWAAIGLQIEPYQAYQPGRINETGSLKIANQSYPDGYDYIIAVDGDGDRLLLKKQGKILDGDDILAHLANNQIGVGATIMSNQGVLDDVSSRGVRCLRSDVGDHHLKALLQSNGWRYGAEPCGHILDLQWMGYSDPCYLFSHILDLGDIHACSNKVYQYHGLLPYDVDLNTVKAVLSHPKIRQVIRRSNTERVTRVMLEGDESLVRLQLSQALNSFSILEKKEA